jgi:hypothetical protein
MYRTIEDEPLQTEGDCRLALRTNTHTLLDDAHQRGLNDFKRARLSWGRMIRIQHPLSHPFTLFTVSKLPLFLTLLVCRRSS